MTDRDGLELRSEVTTDGEVRLSLVAVPVPTAGPGQVLVRMQAAPINPSDVGLLLARADPDTLRVDGTGVDAVVTATIPAAAMPGLALRVGRRLTVGNEGAGEVVAAGTDAEGLLGRTVAVLGGSTYARYQLADAKSCLPLPDGTTAAEGASAFVNPLTVLGMIGTLRREGHTAVVHTAAASNLGQMLIKVCRAEDVPLVAVVRRAEQADLLRALGAEHVCDSSRPSFVDDLAAAVAATGATLGFDATGGGPLAGQILVAMEHAAAARMTDYSPYGSTTRKQVYVYGGLDPRPLEIDRRIGLTWGVGGWLLGPYLASITDDERADMSARVGAELGTTFASSFGSTVSLAQALQPDVIRSYARASTGAKFLIDPSRPD